MATLPPEVLANIAGKRLGIDTQRQRGLQDLGNQYNMNVSNLGDYEKDAQRRINDQYASQGIADSGIRVDEQGRLQKNIGQRRGMLGQQYAQGQSGIQSQYESAIQALNDYQTEQMTGQTRQDLSTQLQQQQIAAQNAATMQAAASANQPMGQGGGVIAGGANDPNAWYAQQAADEYARQLWFQTIYNNNLEREYTNRNAAGQAVRMR